MDNNTNNVDKVYDNLMNTIDEMDKKYAELKPGEQLSDKDFKKVSNALKEANKLVESSDDDINNVQIPENIPEDREPHVANLRHDNSTGISVVTEDRPSKFTGDLDTEYNISNDDIINMLNDHFGEMEDLKVISELIKRKANGEQFNVYKELPSSFKLIVDSEAVKYPDPKQVRNMISEMMLNELAEEVKKNAGMDIDDLLLDIRKDLEKYADGLSTETAKFSLDMNKENLETLEEAIKKATEDNDQEKLDRFISIKKAIEDSNNLNDFKEYCKKVKIKKFDIEKPSRWFQDLLRKYENHKYNIYNISDCDKVLDRHFNNDDNYHIRNIALLITFCKYTMNYNPDNIYEHTFMYYFIKNIITLDRLKPRGVFVDIEGAIETYNSIYKNIEECLEYIRLPK